MAEASKAIKLRPSSANLFSKCAAAAHGHSDDFVINWEGKAANVGSALHMAAKALVLRDQIPEGEIQRKYGLVKSEQRDLRMLIYCVRKYCDEQLHGGGWSKELVVEQRMEGSIEGANARYDVGGTPDVWGLSADKTLVGTVDWKTTRLETADYAPQQMFYLWLVMQWMRKVFDPKRMPKYFQYHIVYVRDWTEEVSEAYTADELEVWVLNFIEKVEAWDGREYHPGGHCMFCPRQADCPAILRMVGALCRAVRDSQFEATAAETSDEDLIDFYVKSNAVKAILDNAKELLKALVVGRGGEVSGSGGVLVTNYRPSYEIDTLKAWPIAEAILTEQELADACRLSKMALLEGVGKYYPRGQKGKGKEDFWDTLCEAEAVEQKDSIVLQLKKAKLIDDKNFQD